MQRFILTGAPGAGKTVLIEQLAALGHGTVKEAATDIIAEQQARGIAEPWKHAAFLEQIAQRQSERIQAASAPIQIHDRSPLCTVALARHLGFPVPATLETLVQQMADEHLFDRRVFYVESLGFIKNTDARRISLADAKVFGALHAQIYQAHGYQLVPVAAAPPADRALQIVQAIGG